MSRAHPDAPPSWYRLSEESWAEIREAYRNGATARELAARWKVSPGSIYRHACAEGWTKKRSADAIARAHAQAIAAEEAADLASLAPPASAPPLIEPTPQAMRERAMQEMSRALAAGRFSQAREICRLVQGLEQLGAAAEAQAQAEAEAGFDEDFEEGSPPTQLDDTSRWLVQFMMDLQAEALWPQIKSLADQMMSTGSCHPPLIYETAFLRWRAENLGPAVAAADREQRRSSSRYNAFYDEAGNVREPFEVLTNEGGKPGGVDEARAAIRAAVEYRKERNRRG